MTKAICDQCNTEFDMDLKTRIVERDIELVYFTCPHCEHEYQSYYTNAKIRTRQEQIKKLFTKIRFATTKEKQKAIYARIDKLKEWNLTEMNQLKERFKALD